MPERARLLCGLKCIRKGMGTVLLPGSRYGCGCWNTFSVRWGAQQPLCADVVLFQPWVVLQNGFGAIACCGQCSTGEHTEVGQPARQAAP